MTRMHLMWFCAFNPHAGFGLDGWAGPRTNGYEWTRPELWQDMPFSVRVGKMRPRTLPGIRLSGPSERTATHSPRASNTHP